jgi:ATP-dependent DNA helicase RecG
MDPAYLQSPTEHVEQGVIEQVGRGRGARLLLSHRFYRHLGKSGVYTRMRGLDQETNKALLAKHIEDNRHRGATLDELRQVLPSLSRDSVRWLVRQLKAEGRIRMEGRTRAARWFPVTEPVSAAKGGPAS